MSPIINPGGAAAAAASGIVKYSATSLTSGNLSTASTTFVDATGVTVTATTGAHRCIVVLTASVQVTLAGSTVCVDVAVDGTLQGGAFGSAFFQNDNSIGTGPGATTLTVVLVTAVLTAASHTVKAQWRVTAGTGTLFAAASVTPATIAIIETSLAT